MRDATLFSGGQRRLSSLDGLCGRWILDRCKQLQRAFRSTAANARRRRMQARVGRTHHFEPLESRQLLTSTIFLDFGEGFGDNGLTTSVAELRSPRIFGPDLAW